MKTKTKKEFTLVELVIVIAVIAVLAAVLIPTFSNLINKANESADIQAVQQMNIILKTDEATNGIPANVEAVKTILGNNNMSNYNPMVDSYVFAWDPDANTIVLVNRESNKAEYPSNYAKKTYLANWELLDGKVNVSIADLEAANLEEALSKIESNQTIKLSEDTNLSKNPSNITSDFSIDLDGHTLTMEDTQSIYVKEGGNAKITNGTIIMNDGDYSPSIQVFKGATLILQNVTIKSSENGKLTYGVNIMGDNGRIDMKNCRIEATVGVSTNASSNYGKDVIFNAYNCIIGNEEYTTETGIWLNVAGKYNIYNSKIYATEECILNRCGDMYIENTICNYQPKTTYKDNPSDEWETANHVFFAPIVVGDWSKNYNNDANCILVDVKVNIDTSKYQYTGADVFISQDGNNTASLTCDNTISYEVCSYTNSSITFGNVYINGEKKSQGAKSN